MYNHMPADFICPMCTFISGVENTETWIKQSDIFYRDEWAIGFISAKFIPGNEGHPLIACIPHFENIYDLHQQYAHGFIDLLRRVSIALKEIRHCDGVRIIQNNEPAAGQHAFHFHAHAIPRFSGDVYDTQRTKVRMSSPEERIGYARQLREYFSS